MILGACLMLACATGSSVETPAVGIPPETPAVDPDDPDSDETPPLPAEGDWELSDDDALPDYDGSLADDAARDAVDVSDDDYWENSEFSNTVGIAYANNAAEVTVPDGAAVYRDGAHVVVDLATGGVKNCEIRLSGSSSDGSLKIYSDNKFRIVLDGLSLASQRGPALNNQSKKRTFLHLSDGTVNTLVDAASYRDDIYYPAGVASADEDRKGALFSEGQLILSGTGSLCVEGRARHAVATDEYFRMRPGATVAVTGAVKNGIHAKEGVRIDGGLLYVRVGGEASKAVKTDGEIDIRGGRLRLFISGEACYDADDADTSSSAALKSDGNTTISGGRVVLKSTGTGGKGINCDGAFSLTDGILEVLTTGGKYCYTQALTSSPKGVKADGDILISGGRARVRVLGASDGSEGIESKAALRVTGGETSVTAYDDAMNAATSISIEGGYLYCYSVNNDGIDSNGTMHVSGGVVIASGTRQPEQGIDCDNNPFAVTGGTLIASGGGTSKPAASLCTQPSVIVDGISAQAGSCFCLSDAEGEALAVFTIPRTMESMCLLLSAPSLRQGASCTLSAGGSADGTETWYGYYAGAQYEGGDALAEFTLTSMVTTAGNSQGGGWPGGGGPGGGGPGGGGPGGDGPRAQ